jgi:hypothetical protein
MPQRHRFLAAAFVLGSMVAVHARANISATLVQGPTPTAGAIVDDPNLTGYQTLDLKVTLTDTPGTGPDDWLSARVEFYIQPVAGKGFYNTMPYTDPNSETTFTADDLKVPQKAAWNFQPNRELQFDTWVAGPNNLNQPSIFGKGFPAQPVGSEVMQGTTATNGTEINVSWGDLRTDLNPAGGSVTYTIGRFAVPIGATGFIHGDVFAANAVGTAVPITSSVPGIAPEPASLGLLGIAAGFMLRRPKRRA